MFNIDFDNLITFLLPGSWRKPKFIAWLKLIISQIKAIYDEFYAFRIQMLYIINFTGQIIYLEKKLNDTFDCEGIYIENLQYSKKIFLFNKGENFLPVYTGNLFVEGIYYSSGNWVIYENNWYSYFGLGNGGTPNLDPNASYRGEIETMIGSADSDFYFFDFTVFVPLDVYNSMNSDERNKLKKIIEYYKLVEMRYIIQTY